jgi:hypothetical protein
VPDFIIAKQIPDEFQAFLRSFIFPLRFTTKEIWKTALYSVAEIATGFAKSSEYTVSDVTDE